MLMMQIVPCVDIFDERNNQLTSVNTKETLESPSNRITDTYKRDFRIRTELCNFAQNLKCANDT